MNNKYLIYSQKISVVKDTIREFDGYVCQAKAKVDTMMDALNLDSIEMSMNNDEGEKEEAEEEDCEDDNEMEDMDEDECYDINEIQTAEESISTMRVAMEVLKCSLTILTTMADQNSRTPSAVAISSRTSAAIDSDNQSDLKDENNEKIDHDSTVQNAEVEGNGDVINSKQSIDSEGLNDADDNYSCDQWVADVSQYAAIIENAVTDFGAELYPPLNATALENLGIQGGKLKNNLHFYILLLQKKSLHIEESHHEESPSITSIALENFLQLVTVSK